MRYLNRTIENELNEWKMKDDRFPLLIRGARQVGKSSLIRQLGKQFEYYIELNLNKIPNFEMFLKVIFSRKGYALN